MEAVLDAFPVLSFDLLIARVHARLWAGLASSGTDVGVHDRIVAATAISSGWRVGSATTRHFGRIPGLDVALVSLGEKAPRACPNSNRPRFVGKAGARPYRCLKGRFRHPDGSAMSRKDPQDNQGFEDIEGRLRGERPGLSPLELDRVRTHALARAGSAGQKRDLFGLQSGSRRLAAAGMTFIVMAAGTGSVLAAGAGSSSKVGAAAAQYTEPEPEHEVKGVCAISKFTVRTLHGAEGEKTKPFKVSVASLGIKKITFYIDGKKYTVLKKAKAKHGKFTITIDPAKYGYGMHKVTIKTAMTDPDCDPATGKGGFVRPKEEKPLFTG